MNPYLIIAALVAVMAAGAGGFKLGIDHQKANDTDKKELVSEAVDAANQASAEAIAKIRVHNTTITQEVRHEVETQVVYRDCHNTPDGMSGINSALTGAEPASGGQLPKADTAH